jgi:hypothetical protein
MKPGRVAYLLLWSGLVVMGLGCGDDETLERAPATLAVEAEVGDFLDYYSTVLHLSARHSAHPDSFRVALDSLPGSHVTDDEWEAWTAPYREHPNLLAGHLEEVIAELRSQ